MPVEQTIETEPELETLNTEDTRESYQTSPEISLATQNLFEALLGKKPTDPERKQDMAEGKKSTDVEMKDATRKVAEMKLSPPKAFTGKRDGLEEFVQNVQLYLDINEETYDTDKKKIGYMLSFMDDGDAKSWRAAFLQSVTTDGVLNLGSWKDFLEKVVDSFKPYDAPGDALEELLELRMGNFSVDDHIPRLKIILEKTGVPDTSLLAID